MNYTRFISIFKSIPYLAFSIFIAAVSGTSFAKDEPSVKVFQSNIGSKSSNVVKIFEDSASRDFDLLSDKMPNPLKVCFESYKIKQYSDCFYLKTPSNIDYLNFQSFQSYKFESGEIYAISVSRPSYQGALYSTALFETSYKDKYRLISPSFDTHTYENSKLFSFKQGHPILIVAQRGDLGIEGNDGYSDGFYYILNIYKYSKKSHVYELVNQFKSKNKYQASEYLAEEDIGNKVIKDELPNIKIKGGFYSTWVRR